MTRLFVFLVILAGCSKPVHERPDSFVGASANAVLSPGHSTLNLIHNFGTKHHQLGGPDPGLPFCWKLIDGSKEGVLESWITLGENKDIFRFAHPFDVAVECEVTLPYCCGWVKP
jgi:hypothetical protein